MHRYIIPMRIDSYMPSGYYVRDYCYLSEKLGIRQQKANYFAVCELCYWQSEDFAQKVSALAAMLRHAGYGYKQHNEHYYRAMAYGHLSKKAKRLDPLDEYLEAGLKTEGGLHAAYCRLCNWQSPPIEEKYDALYALIKHLESEDHIQAGQEYWDLKSGESFREPGIRKKGGYWFAFCKKCGWQSKPTKSPFAATDELWKHDDEFSFEHYKRDLMKEARKLALKNDNEINKRVMPSLRARVK